jgi:L-amino acid N-acyltransferase YncA
MRLRPAAPGDWPGLWDILRPVFGAGDTYMVPPDIAEAEARTYWTEAPREVWLAEEAGRILGTYYLRTNQPGPGDHVCNCGYVTGAQARGRGVARTMCLHSQDRARELGYAAMQFNAVVSTNAAALHLWTDLGFRTVGTVPGAFRHPMHGRVDTHVLFKDLTGGR